MYALFHPFADRLKAFLPRDKTFVIILLAGLVGCAGAFAVYGFRLCFVALQHLLKADATGMVDIARSLSWWQRLFLPALGGLLAGALLQYVIHWAPRRGSDDYLEAITVGDGNLGVRQTLIKSAASLCSISTGASIGREGPMAQLAALTGAMFGNALKLSKSRIQLLVACGATAGLASAYNAPIAGLLFVAEIAFGSLSQKTLAPMIVASVMGSVVTHRFFGVKAVYQMPHFALSSDWETVLFVGLGLACGFAAPIFRFALDLSRKSFGRLPKNRMLTMSLGGLGVGALSVWEPGVWGNGYSVVNALLHDPAWSLQAILAILVFKIIATALSYGSGAVGGVFTPTLFVGAALGALYGHTVIALGLAPPDATAVSYTIVGMGAFLSSVTYAPLMSILMIFEMTLSYEIVLPLMLACVLGHQVAQRFRKDSIYRKAR